jgi:hypothetical protein
MNANRGDNIMYRFMLAACALLIVGCAQTAPMTKSGFLGSYEGFEPEGGDGRMLVYNKEPGALRNHEKILIEPFQVIPTAKGILDEHSEAELKDLALYFEEEIKAALALHYKLVDQPGPGVMKVRCAIVDVDPGDPTMFLVGHAPYVGAVSSAKQATTGKGFGAGQVAIEAEILDSVSGERLMAFIDRDIGTQLDIFSGMSDWGHAKDGFRHWAKRFKEHLDATQAQKAKSQKKT